MSSTSRPLGRLQQLPPTPTNQDPQTRIWMDAMAAFVRKITSGDSRIVTIGELAAAGVLTANGGPVDSTAGGGADPSDTPPKLTGLTASGAMDNIFLSWTAPTYSKFNYAEIYRSSTNDIGTATKIGFTNAALYADAVGSGASYYYWIRGVSLALIAGEFNAAAGTLGATGLDPTYVMSLLTSHDWAPSTTYVPFQYVRPTTENGFQYRCIDGGVSAPADEPVWPTTPGATIVDDGVTWQCLNPTDQIPFVIGEINGIPAVAMSGAYIEDATISTAKIRNLAADKIITGTLAATETIQVGGAIWSGYASYRDDDTGGAAGVWLGMVGSSPRFQLSTAGDFGTYKRISFNGSSFSLIGIDLLSSADGSFDDLYADSLSADRTTGNSCAFNEYLSIAQGAPPFDNPAVNDYLAYLQRFYRSVYAVSAYGFIGHGAIYQTTYGNRVATTALNNDIIPYNEASTNHKRSVGQNIGFNLKFTKPYMSVGVTANCVLKLIDNAGVTRVTIDLSGNNLTSRILTVPVSTGGTIDVSVSFGTTHGLVSCFDDGGALGYTSGVRYKCEYGMFNGTNVGTGNDSPQQGTVEVWFQIATIPNATEDPGSPLVV